MKPKFIQVSCTEGNKIDLRQSRAVLKHKPDIIFLEYPSNLLKPITKPLYINKDIVKRYPWTESDNHMWKNIVSLWKNKYKTTVYAVDGPRDLVVSACIYPFNKKQPRKTDNLFWWTRIFLRDCFMAYNIEKVLRKHKLKKNSVVLVFLQSFHWKDVKFLLSSPSKQKIWNFYFGRFKELNKKDLPEILRKENKILLKYWNSKVNLLN